MDASGEMAAAARALGHEVIVRSPYDLDFASALDGAFSNAATRWMKNVGRVSVASSLRPEGRFAVETDRYGCVERTHFTLIGELSRLGYDGVIAPWFFLTGEDYASRLVAASLDLLCIDPIPCPTLLPGNVMGWLTTFSQSFCAVLPQLECLDYLEAVRSRIEPQLFDAGGHRIANYMSLRFEARLKKRKSR